MEQLKEGFDSVPDRTVEVIIAQFSARLGDSFAALINEDSNQVTVSKIPENEKTELDYLLANQGYQVTYT